MSGSTSIRGIEVSTKGKSPAGRKFLYLIGSIVGVLLISFANNGICVPFFCLIQW